LLSPRSREFGNRMSDYPDMDPYGDGGGAYSHLSQGLFSWEHRPSSFSASSVIRSSDAGSDGESPANSTLYGASDVSEGLRRTSSRRALLRLLTGNHILGCPHVCAIVAAAELKRRLAPQSCPPLCKPLHPTQLLPRC